MLKISFFFFWKKTKKKTGNRAFRTFMMQTEKWINYDTRHNY